MGNKFQSKEKMRNDRVWYQKYVLLIFVSIITFSGCCILMDNFYGDGFIIEPNINNNIEVEILNASDQIARDNGFIRLKDKVKKEEFQEVKARMEKRNLLREYHHKDKNIGWSIMKENNEYKVMFSWNKKELGKFGKEIIGKVKDRLQDNFKDRIILSEYKED